MRYTYYSPQHCNNHCCSNAPGFALANESHDDVEKEQYSQWQVTPVGREGKRASSHYGVLYVGAWKLELGKKHEEQDDVDRDCEEVDELGAGGKYKENK